MSGSFLDRLVSGSQTISGPRVEDHTNVIAAVQAADKATNCEHLRKHAMVCFTATLPKELEIGQQSLQNCDQHIMITLAKRQDVTYSTKQRKE